jgi:hypothetical protein
MSEVAALTRPAVFFRLNADQWAYIEQKAQRARRCRNQARVNEVRSVRPGCLPVGAKLSRCIGLAPLIDDEVDNE